MQTVLSATIDRRSLLALFVASLNTASCGAKEEPAPAPESANSSKSTKRPKTQQALSVQPPLAKAAKFVKPSAKWTGDDMFDFLQALPASVMLELKKAHGLLKPEATEAALLGPTPDAREIQKKFLKISSNIFSRQFRDASDVNYHDVVKWVSNKMDAPKQLVGGESTFGLEKSLYKLLFVQQWEKLTERERLGVLEKIDGAEKIANKAQIAAMGGAAALGALGGTVALSGFAFYTTLTSLIFVAAGAFGATLPFAAYAGATTAASVLAGPVGWAVAVVLGLGGLALAGRADLKKTIQLVAHIHGLKAEALQAARLPIPE